MITLELIRKRSEHNEGEIATLEEISLHQEKIEKIELLDKVCRQLRIVLLQHNLIERIENVGRLKRLEYLNLALNNIEVIENLQGCESLRKLDLTLNFVGDVRDVKSLRANEHLEQLFLTGNPCADYDGYRECVASWLPQLRELDSREITRSERIEALQAIAEAEGNCIRAQRRYAILRESQRLDSANDQPKITEIYAEQDDENAKFWQSKSHNTPEERKKLAERINSGRSCVTTEVVDDGCKQAKRQQLKLFSPSGRPYNVNQGRLAFTLNDECDSANIVLTVSLYKHLDTSYVNVDVEPSYVRVSVKGKVLQLTLSGEVHSDKSEAKRNVTSGDLVVTMPRVTPLLTPAVKQQVTTKRTKNVVASKVIRGMPVRELLEIGPTSRCDNLDFANIVKSEIDFVDDPQVPPLE